MRATRSTACFGYSARLRDQTMCDSQLPPCSDPFEATNCRPVATLPVRQNLACNRWIASARATERLAPRPGLSYHSTPMAIALAERIGRDTTNTLAGFGDFCRFVGRMFAFLPSIIRWKNMRLLFPQMYEVGVRSVPVVGITGAFIGMVLAVESHTQFKTLGQEQ